MLRSRSDCDRRPFPDLTGKDRKEEEEGIVTLAVNAAKKKSTAAKNTSAKRASAKKGGNPSAARKSAKASATVKSRTKTAAPVPEQETANPLIIREAVLWLILAACILLFISYFGIGGYLGEVISDVSFGIFGIAAYLFPFLVFISSAFLISNSGSKIAAVKFLSAVGVYLCICSFAALFAYGEYGLGSAAQLYETSAAHRNGGGVVGGTICSLLSPALGVVGAGVILFVLMIVFFVLITQKSLMRCMKKQSSNMYRSAKESSARRREAHRREREQRQDEAAVRKQEEQHTPAVRGQEKTEPQKELDIPVLFQAQSRESRVHRRVSGVTTDTKIVGNAETVGAEIHEIMPKRSTASKRLQETPQDEAATSYIDLESITAKKEKAQDAMPLHIEGIEDSAGEDSVGEDSVRADKKDADLTAAEKEENQAAETASAPAARKNPRSSRQEIEEGIASVQAEVEKAEEEVKAEYVFPPLDLLKKGAGRSGSNQEQEIRKTATKLQQTLESFGVRVTITNVSCGPSVTRYELLPEQGVKVSKIVSLSDDIKLNLAAADIRIEAPIPGKAAVGIEVPNTENSAVALRDLLESNEFQKHPSRLAFATGKDIAGKVVVSDIARMPHLLIAGATGSGKSVCINTLIMSILYKAKPDEVKLIMIDPKVVELSVYNGIPHLYIPVVTDPKKAAGALNWGVAEMTDRYNKFAEFGVRDLKGYNKKIDALRDVKDEDKPKKLPQIVIIVDELADLMMVAPGEVEDSICRLAQLARAAGIHLIIATQRPSVNVITGLIKANMPSRIAFSVTSSVDSRTIIDMGGAEKLLGKGDMLFYPQGYQKPARVQGAFVSDEEVSDVVDFLKNKNTDSAYSAEVEEQIAKVQHAASAAKGGEDTDALFADAGKFIIEKDKASIGMLQRVFKIGFNRAARIMDQLSDAGVVGPEEGTKPRKILMSAEQFENYLEEN